MTTITKEELTKSLQRRISFASGFPESKKAQIDLELARIALASIEAEAIAVRARWKDDGCGHGDWRYYNIAHLAALMADETRECELVYAAPPVPVVPAALPENDDEDGHDIDYLEPSEVYALGRSAGWNACRAAMLHGAEPVSQTYKLNELSGNYPVTPDGWVMVPKEPTQAMIKAWLSEIANFRGHAAGYRAALEAAPQLEVNRG